MMEENREMILTPCLPHRSCIICENRLFPKNAPPEKKAARFRHQAEMCGIEAIHAIEEKELNLELIRSSVIRAVQFAKLALKFQPDIASTL
jgi:hypothetical protein